MSERKSPPGPREMVQEHKVINTYSPPGFTTEVEPQPSPSQPPSNQEDGTSGDERP